MPRNKSRLHHNLWEEEEEEEEEVEGWRIYRQR
jgi:hypothetical protein